MDVPDPWPALLLAAAAFRIYRLLAKDSILDRPRSWLVRLPIEWDEGDVLPDGFKEKWSTFIVCPWCLGFWVCLAWWGAWQIWPHGTLVCASLWLLSSFVGLVAKLDADD